VFSIKFSTPLALFQNSIKTKNSFKILQFELSKNIQN
jgi:hypothetical protein